MSRAQFEYDEIGNTFYYFILSVFTLILIPGTFYLWPSKKEDDYDKFSQWRCHCDGCEMKLIRQKAKLPWLSIKKMMTRFTLLVCWIGLILLAYKVSQIEITHEEYDPYAILELDRGAETSQIKRKYRDLSKKYHPDRGGDAKLFDRIAKAYQALTDDESRRNWELYGNPDGPGATTFGIALPKWIVSNEYGVWVLVAYGLLLLVVLPLGVGIWWYNSIKYSADQVLIDTTRLFLYMFQKTPNMLLRRVLMILGSSFEFSKKFNAEIVERESDERDVPLLIKELPNMNEKNKERPLCAGYSIKARALIYAHLSRIDINNPDSLGSDQSYLLRKCPMLIQEMVQVISQLVFYGRPPRIPSVDTVENVMKVLPMLVQAIWDSRSPLLQLPHFTEDMLRHCVTKKRRVRTCADMASLEESESRSLCRNLSSAQYADVLNVLRMMPHLSVDCHLEVQGEDDKHEITAGSLVTLRVELTRSSLLGVHSQPSCPSLEQNDDPDECLPEEVGARFYLATC